MSFDRTLFRAAVQARIAERKAPLREIAKEAGISASTLSRIVNGEAPDIETFTTLVEWLKIDANAFVHNPNPASIMTEQEQWAWLTLCLQELDMPKELIEAIVTIVRLIRSKKP